MAQREKAEVQADRREPVVVAQTIAPTDIEFKIKSQFFEEKAIDDEIQKGFIKDRKSDEAEAIRLEARFTYEEEALTEKVIKEQLLKPPRLAELKVNENMEYEAQTKSLVKGCCGSSVKTSKFHLKVDRPL